MISHFGAFVKKGLANRCAGMYNTGSTTTENALLQKGSRERAHWLKGTRPTRRVPASRVRRPNKPAGQARYSRLSQKQGGTAKQLRPCKGAECFFIKEESTYEGEGSRFQAL